MSFLCGCLLSGVLLQEVIKMNNKLGQMEESKQKIPAEVERAADLLNHDFHQHEHYANMLFDHNPFRGVITIVLNCNPT